VKPYVAIGRVSIFPTGAGGEESPQVLGVRDWEHWSCPEIDGLEAKEFTASVGSGLDIIHK